MEPSSSVVIKVKYGDVLRRFNARVVDLSFVNLREKIVYLFSFAPDIELMLTYVDEDNDVVNLVDDDDIRDVVKQGLNPLRITVEVNSGKNGEQYASSTESSTPLRLPQMQQPTQNLHNGVSEILRTYPKPLQEALVKLSSDLTSRASSSAPVVSELLDSISKVAMSYLTQLSEPQPGVQSGMEGGASQSNTATETNESGIRKVDPAPASASPPVKKSDLSSNNSDGLEKLKPGVVMENEVKIPSVTGGRKDGSSFDFSAVAAALESQNMNVSSTGNDSSLSPAPVRLKSVAISQSKKGKFKKAIEMSPLLPVMNQVGKNVESGDSTSTLPAVTNKVIAGEVACNPNEPKLELNHGKLCVSAPKAEGCIDIKRRSTAFHGVKKSSDPLLGTSSMNECPFSGISVASEAISSGKNTNQNDSSQIIIHHGIICDGCDVHPITGPRFKSKVKVDYDLCSVCFEKMGNNADYIRMDFPVVRQRHVHIMDALYYDGQGRGRGLNLPQVYNDHKVKPVAIKLDSCFVEDVNIIDGTIVAPLTPFTKIWRMRNNGTVGWLQGTQLVWIGGDKMSNVLSVELKIPAGGVWMDQVLDVAAHCISPDCPGQYVSHWRMATPSGEIFGQRVWVHIQVDASIKKTPRETIRNLNLNLPPGVNNCFDGPEIINVEPEPWVKGSHPEPDNSKKIVELIQPETEQDLKFPINDNLLVGNVASSTAQFSASSSSISYPVVDLSSVSLLPPPSVPPVPHHPLPSQFKAFTANAHLESTNADKKVDIELEEMLLRRLEAMGFNHVDLNRDVLRMNKYNLEQAVDDLCNCGQGDEWDPLLDELKEMGFADREKNKLLLMKHNGSIKLVVMDLIGAKMD